MRRISLGIFLIGSCMAQDPATSLPTYIGGGVSYNQLATPRWSPWVTAIYQAPIIPPSLQTYMSTTTNVIPVLATDPTTGRKFYAFQTSIRQGLHKTILTRGRFTLLIGADAGIGLSQVPTPTAAAPSNSSLSANLTSSFTASFAFQVTKNITFVVPTRALWLGQATGWNFVPEFGVLFKR